VSIKTSTSVQTNNVYNLELVTVPTSQLALSMGSGHRGMIDPVVLSPVGMERRQDDVHATHLPMEDMIVMVQILKYTTVVLTQYVPVSSLELAIVKTFVLCMIFYVTLMYLQWRCR
jgi:hypothetical protein